ncbi:hypothetical protein HKX48_000100 [Thoreauomyces humboldtii]|nr:hypothetical protein HKX48_000100 [Thoreauomyces humboldtii]
MATGFSAQDLNSSDDSDEDFAPDARRADVSDSGHENTSSDGGTDDEAIAPGAKRKRKAGIGKGSKRTTPPSEFLEIAQNDDVASAAAAKSRIDSIWAEMNAPLARTKLLSHQSSTQAATSAVVLPPATVISEPIPIAPSVTADESTGQRRPPAARKSNLLALAAKYGLADAARLTILEQSKVDWKRHVEEQGDSHDLDQARQNGYLDKVDFLKRTDDRQADLVTNLKRKTTRR